MALTDSTATQEEQRPILASTTQHRQDSSLVNALLSAVGPSNDSYRTMVSSSASSSSSTAPRPAPTGAEAPSAADDSSDSSSDESDLLPKSNGGRNRRSGPCNIQRMRQAAFVVSQVGLLLFFGTLTAVIIKAPWEYPYSWHPILMCLFGLLATEAVLVLQPKEAARHKRKLKTVHAVVHGITFVWLIIGFVAIYLNKNKKGKKHFTSYHAWFGTAATVMLFAQLVFGVLVGYFPRMFRNLGQPRVMRLHRVLGYVSIALLWITLWLGTITNWMNRNFDKPWIMNLSTTMVAIGMVAGITPDRLFRRSGYRSFA